MTKQKVVSGTKLSEPDQLRPSVFLGITRRDTFSVAAAGIAFFVTDDPAQPAAEASAGKTGGATENRSDSERQQQAAIRADSDARRTEQRQPVDKFNNLTSLLGSEFRGRSGRIQTLATHQLDATGTHEAPDGREVEAGDYFSNGFSHKLMSSSESPLGTALRTRNGGLNPPTRISSEELAALSKFVSPPAQMQKPNEGRAEVFFGGAAKVVADGVGIYATARTGIALGATNTGANLAGLSATSLGLTSKMFGTPGREAGEAFGRWVDPMVEQFKNNTGYDSRTDPRFNPIGWPYD